MSNPELIANWDAGEGIVRFPPTWREHSAQARADVLADWISELSAEYIQARRDALPRPQASFDPHPCGND